MEQKMDDDVIIKIENLTKSYGKKRAVSDLTLSIGCGEVFGLLGPNGAGKTTTTLMLLGLTEPDSGKAWINGKDCTRNAIEVKRIVGYLPDNVGFYSDMTGRENLRFTGQLNGLPGDIIESRIEALLEKVGLSGAGDQKTGTYSRGMRQRLGVADVLMKEPKVVIMDEPTLGIDPEGMRELMVLIRSLAEKDKRTILISSHQLYQIQQVCDRVGLFVEGRLMACGRIEELAAQLRQEGHYVLEAGAAPDDGGFEARVERKGEHYVVYSRSDLCRELNRKALDRGYTLCHLRQKENDLDEIYRRYFEKGEQGDGSLTDRKNKGFLSFKRG